MTSKARCAASRRATWAWAATVSPRAITSRAWTFARYTLFAEGARGHLSKQVIARFALDASAPQVYGLGIKELWDIAPQAPPGLVIHTQGWPLTDAYGGGFLYHQADGRWPWALSPGWAIAIRISRPWRVPALEAASRDLRLSRGRQARVLWCAGH
jgi:hypothetical protein